MNLKALSLLILLKIQATLAVHPNKPITKTSTNTPTTVHTTTSSEYATYTLSDFPTYASASACSLATDLSLTPGYKVKYYSYSDLDTSDFTQINFLASGYTANTLYQSVNGIVAPQFLYSYDTKAWGYHSTTTSMIYGMNVQITNFLFEYTGYFKGKF